MTSDRTILITGVTGNQGGAVAQALQGAGFSLRGLTRKPEAERAAALAREAGVEHYVYTSVGSAHKQTGVPHFDNKVAHRGNRARPPLPLACDPASGVLHGEPGSAFQSPGHHAGLGTRARHEATDDCGGRHRLARRAPSPTPPPRTARSISPVTYERCRTRRRSCVGAALH